MSYDIKASGFLNYQLVDFLGDLITLLSEMLTASTTRCIGNAGLAIATTVTKIQVATAFDYMIDGTLYTKAVTDNITFTATAVQADSTFCKYLASIDSSGTVTMTKGTEASTALLATLPDVPSSEAPIGYVQIATSGGTFTGGTTDLDDASVTDTYVNLAQITPTNVALLKA